MFGRKRKQEEDNLGLSAPFVSSTATAAPAASITPTPVAGTPPTVPGMPTMPTSSAAMLAQILSGRGQVGNLVKEIQADPQAFRSRIMAQAQAAGVSTFVMTPQGLQASGGAAAAPSHVDVVDELTKAAALHDKGVLTDDEFHSLKDKLLGQ
jgi:hypothetical protein